MAASRRARADERPAGRRWWSPLVGMGAPMVTNTWPLFTSGLPAGMSARVPRRPMGTIGTPALHARWKPPFLKGPICPSARARALREKSRPRHHPNAPGRPSSILSSARATAFLPVDEDERPAPTVKDYDPAHRKRGSPRWGRRLPGNHLRAPAAPVDRSLSFTYETIKKGRNGRTLPL